MPANTIDSMILGYAVILGILITYGISLAIRFNQVRKQENNQEE